MTVRYTVSKALLPLAGAVALAACGGDAEETTYEADVVDESGGEMIVTDPEAPAVEDQQIPETPMTPVPPGDEPTATEPAPAATPTPE